jgi:hypothetical protein
VNPAGSAASWLDEIQRTAGDISPATATEIQRVAEYAYQQYAEHWGQAWGQYAARQSAKEVLAGVATETDPEVVAAHCAYRKAQEHADRLFAASAGPDGRADLDTPEGLAAWVADHEAGERYEEFREVWGEATRRYSAEVNHAWRKADADFMTAHRADLQAAWPEGFAQVSAEPSAVVREGAAATDPDTARLAAASFPGQPATGLDFPSAPAGCPANSSGRRAGRSGVTSHTGQARPGRLR